MSLTVCLDAATKLRETLMVCVLQELDSQRQEGRKRSVKGLPLCHSVVSFMLSSGGWRDSRNIGLSIEKSSVFDKERANDDKHCGVLNPSSLHIDEQNTHLELASPEVRQVSFGA